MNYPLRNPSMSDADTANALDRIEHAPPQMDIEKVKDL
jgi:hypothetical protein